MKKTLKTGLKFLGVLILVAVMAGIWQRDRVERLYHAVTLFWPDRIVRNFSHMDDAFLSIPIENSGPVDPWPVDLAELPMTYRWNGENQNLADALERTATTSLLVVRDGTIVAERYYLGTGQGDLRISWSVAKSFVSALIGIALDEGAISSIDAAVTDYVPMLKGTAYDGASLRNVLNMASGVTFDEDYLKFNSDINHMGRVLALGGSMDAFVAGYRDRDRAPGVARQYVSIDTHVLAMVLRAATGKRMKDYLSEKLWSKIGPEGAAYYLTDGYGIAFALGGLNMTTRDYARFGQLFLDEGSWHGQQVVPAEWVRASVQASAPPVVNPNDPFGYGYQWWLPTEPDGEFYAVGIYGQYIYVNPKARIIVVKTSADRNFRADGHEGFVIKQETIAMFRAIAEHFSNWRHPNAQ